MLFGLDLTHRLEFLEGKDDFLSRLNALVDWEWFREILEEGKKKSNVGRPAYDVILMFKLLVLQSLYNLSDEQIEYQANDRLSFHAFLNITVFDKVPDATTIWLFREWLTKKELVKVLFDKLDEMLVDSGYIARGGQIIDATFVPVPIQRNTKEENEKLKEGEVPEEWKENGKKLNQKDLEARWTKKNDESHYGYKNHVSIDVENKLIRNYEITDASVHDSQVLGKVISENVDPEIWADSAYYSKWIEWVLLMLKFVSHIHEKGYRNKPLTEEQKAKNKERSKVRSRVEHIFAHLEQMGELYGRVIGLKRIETYVGLKNLAYNLKRFVFLSKSSETAAT